MVQLRLLIVGKKGAVLRRITLPSGMSTVEMVKIGQEAQA